MTQIVEQRHSLAENEEVLRKGLTTFIEVGLALMSIRDERQYVGAGFDTFEDYCRERWDMSRNYADYKIAAAAVTTIVSMDGAPIETEWVARPLGELLNKGGEVAVRNAWAGIVEKHQGEGPITGAQVRRFLTFGEGANYGKPGWGELLGQVGDDLTKAQKDLAKFEAEVGDRTTKPRLRESAGEYAVRAEELTNRLRRIERGE